MTVSAPLPKDHPAIIAWERYKASDEYANSFRWAEHILHREGSMWAAFYAGFVALSAQGDAAQPAITCQVLEYQHSSGHPDYYVSIERNGKQITPYKSKGKGRVEYSVAEWEWLLNDGPKPDILAYDDTIPGDAAQPAAEGCMWDITKPCTCGGGPCEQVDFGASSPAASQKGGDQ